MSLDDFKYININIKDIDYLKLVDSNNKAIKILFAMKNDPEATKSINNENNGNIVRLVVTPTNNNISPATTQINFGDNI